MLKKKIFRLSLFSLISCVLLLLVLQQGLIFYVNNYLSDRLKVLVFRESKGEYQLEIEGIQLNILNQNIVFNNIRLMPLHTMKQQDTKYSIIGKTIRIQGFSVINYFFNKELTIDEINFGEPEVYIYQDDLCEPEDSIKKTFSLYASFGKELNSLIIRNISIRKAVFKVYKSMADTTLVLHSPMNDIELQNFIISPESEKRKRPFLADKFQMQMKDIAYTIGNGLYTLKGKQITISYTDSLITLDSLELSPNYSKKEFAEEAKWQTDRIKLLAEKTSIRGMDVKLFLEKNQLLAKNIMLDTFNMNVFRDKNMPSVNNPALSLQQVIRDFPFFIRVDSLVVNNGKIKYEEVAKGDTMPGWISFNELSGTVTGLSNDTISFSEKSFLTITGKGKFMNMAPVFAVCTFPLNTGKMIFSATGSMGSIPFSEVNTMMVPCAKVSLTKGVVDSLEFNFVANEAGSSGKMKFLYHNLEMKILDKKHSPKGVEVELLSFFVNSFVIKTDNPSKDQKPRITEIKHKRNPNRFIINYTWKSLLSGIKPAIGL